MTTDTDALKERIARSICEHDDAGGDNWDEDRDWYMDQAAAVLPIVAVEVRKAKAEALREAACGMGEWADAALVVTGDEHDESTWVEMTVGEWLIGRATEHETRRSDEHR